MPQARSAASAVAGHDGVFVFGGVGDGPYGSPPLLQFLDLRTDAWRIMDDLGLLSAGAESSDPPPSSSCRLSAYHHTLAAPVPGGILIAMQSARCSCACLLFDSDTFKIRRLPWALPTQGRLFALHHFGGRLHLFSEDDAGWTMECAAGGLEASTGHWSRSLPHRIGVSVVV
jgi:hypothetical protein